ncbi:MAG: TfoX/Sxy family protein [Phycisphaeraceae bacterium]|nr:TfoX/Sxy family protein [Phycisphaerales bacterium]MCB9859619.1 TfoX/Sxy family protein [Phycisphaeraceae bacterium]
MPPSDELNSRIRSALARKRGITETKMFGGIAFMVNGNMCCGAVEDKLMLRLGKDLTKEALKEPHTAPMDYTGKVMSTMIFVLPKGIASDDDLQHWIDRAVVFVRTLPKK